MREQWTQVKKGLRSLAKKSKQLSYSTALVVLFLMLGNSAFSEEMSGLFSRQDIEASANSIEKKIDDLREKNNSSLEGKRLQLIELMEQGDQVVKSPWASWQFGLNFFSEEAGGAFKGRNDKKKEYPYEGIFERDSDVFARNISTDSKQYSKIKSTSSAILEKNEYGLANTRTLNKPKAKLTISPKIALKDPVAFTSFAPKIEAQIPKIPETFIFKTTIPTVAPVTPMTVNVKTVELTSYGNFTQHALYPTYVSTEPGYKLNGYNVKKTEITIPEGVYNLEQNTKSKANPNTIVHTIIDVEESPGLHVTVPEGATLNVNSIGDRAFSIDTNPAWINWPLPGGKFPLHESSITNRGTVNLNVQRTAAFDIQTHHTQSPYPGHEKDRTWDQGKRLYAINAGKVNGLADNQVGMTLTREGAPGVEEHVFRNTTEGNITMNGKNSMAFSFSVEDLHAEAYNEGNITLKGENSYGFAFGKRLANNRFKEGSILRNEESGEINIQGNNSGGFALEEMLNAGTPYEKNVTIENKGKINIQSNQSFGIYSEQLKAINLGEINIQDSSEKSMGMYAIQKNTVATELVNKGSINISSSKGENIGLYTNNAKVINETDGKINVLNGENIGMLISQTGKGENKGEIISTADGAIALMTDGTGNFVNSGKIDVKGGISPNGKGTVGMFAKDTSIISSENGSIKVDVQGDKSIGIYSKSKIELGSTENIADKRAINFFADDGGKIDFLAGKESSSQTKEGSLLFFNGENGLGKTLLYGKLKATIAGNMSPSNRGSVFYYKSTATTTPGSLTGYNSGIQYGTFTGAEVQRFFDTQFGTGAANSSTLGNLELTMEEKSRLFLSPNVKMKLSEAVTSNLFAGLVGAPTFSANSSNAYSSNLLLKSELQIDQDINLDNVADTYRNLEISNSTIINENSVVGTEANQIFMAQENHENDKSYVTLLNDASGKIDLSGDNSLAMYSKYGYIINKGKINLAGEHATAIYGVDNTKITNTSGAEILLSGKKSLGMYYNNISGNPTTEKLENQGSIGLKGANSVAMTYNPGVLDAGLVGGTEVLLENKGNIKVAGEKSIALYGKEAANQEGYIVKNSGEIVIESASTSQENPIVAMYTDAKNNTLLNDTSGKIEVSKNNVALLGYNMENKGTVKLNSTGVAMNSLGGTVNLTAGEINLGAGKAKEESIGLLLQGKDQIANITGTKLSFQDYNYGIVNLGETNIVNFSIPSVNLKNKSVYIYSDDKTSLVQNSTKITSDGAIGENYGIYSNGTVMNSGDIALLGGYGNIALYSFGGTTTNTGKISVGASKPLDKLYSVGMAAGYVEGSSPEDSKVSTIVPKYTGKVVNQGTIDVRETSSIGMYVTGKGSVAENTQNIILNADNTIGIFANEGAEVYNSGMIRTGKSGLKNIQGIVLGAGTKLYNTGSIIIDASSGSAVRLQGGEIVNRGTIQATGGASAETEGTGSKIDNRISLGGIVIDPMKTPEITKDNMPVKPTIVNYSGLKAPKQVAANSIGMYIDTSGDSFTKPIENIGALTENADLIIGAEAASKTTSKYIKIEDPKILGPYQKSMLNNPQVKKWDIYSGSLSWIASATLEKATGTVDKVYLAKIPYTSFASDENATKDTYHFADGLEQRYGVEALGTRENQLFQKLNGIGNNEQVLLFQAYDEMMGHQYANVQQRIHSTGGVLDKEFRYLRKEWTNVSKDSNKVKAFGMNGEYKTNTAGIIDYKNYAQGLAYVHEDETIKLGVSSGWYTGFVRNEFKFQDIGKSKEEMYQGKLGYFRTHSYDDNGSLQWTIAGEAFVGHSKLNRRYLVVDEIFKAKSKFWSYGLALKNELSKEFRLSEGFRLKPYGMLDLEYGRFQKIREKSGEIRLEVKANDYYSIKPELGVELSHKLAFSGRNILKTSLGLAYENELGQVGNANNKARVAHTTAERFNLRGEKEDRRGNLKADLNLGFENTSYGITANIGYDTKANNLRGGLGLRVIF